MWREFYRWLFRFGAKGLHQGRLGADEKDILECVKQIGDNWENEESYEENKARYDKKNLNKDSSKKSKTGRFKLIRDNNSFKTVSIDADGEDYLQTVFRNGELLIDDNFGDIKARALNYSNFL